MIQRRHQQNHLLVLLVGVVLGLAQQAHQALSVNQLPFGGLVQIAGKLGKDLHLPVLGQIQTQGACPNCRGTGKIIKKPCPKCGGQGRVRKTRKFKVNIPAGIDDGQTLNLRGKGNAGLDGGPAGDLLITVFVKPHPLFERDGNSVLMEMPVSFAQAALGAEIEVPTIDGRVKLTIPEGTQPGSVFRLRGKGIPYLQSKGGGRGDQFVTITVTVPKNMTAEQKERLRAYAEAMNESVSEGRSGIFGNKKKR